MRDDNISHTIFYVSNRPFVELMIISNLRGNVVSQPLSACTFLWAYSVKHCFQNSSEFKNVSATCWLTRRWWKVYVEITFGQGRIPMKSDFSTCVSVCKSLRQEMSFSTKIDISHAFTRFLLFRIKNDNVLMKTLM